MLPPSRRRMVEDLRLAIRVSREGVLRSETVFARPGATGKPTCGRFTTGNPENGPAVRARSSRRRYRIGFTRPSSTPRRFGSR